MRSQGTWVHGEDRENHASERGLPKNTVPLVGWSPDVEQLVLKSTDVDGIVIRPALVYGRSGSITGMVFAKAHPGQEVQWAGEPGGRTPTIHVDDLAKLYVLIGEAGPSIKGLIFDAANDHSESVDDILASIAKITGASGYKYTKISNPFEAAIATSATLRPSLARALLGWRPLKPSFVDGLKTYYATWKALN